MSQFMIRYQIINLSKVFNSPKSLNFIKRYTTSTASTTTTTTNDDSNWISTPNITVCGIGGGGCNSVNNMINKELYGIDFVVANTDAQALAISCSRKMVQLGKTLTRGLGAGAVPEVGKKATEESIEELMNQIGDTQMLFVTAGMGGGTGTGGAAVIASAAKAKGILTVGIVTKPFHFEGKHRMKLAEQGLIELEKSVDSLIVIPNEKLMEQSQELYIGNAFQMVDDVLYNSIRGISDILVKPGLINLDFADVRSIMCNSGKALMGVGEGEGKGRDAIAANIALNNPLLENINISGAKGVLLNIAGSDLKLQEVDHIVSLVSSKVDPSANIIFGSTFDQQLEGKIRVTLIVTGMDQLIQQQQQQQKQTKIESQVEQKLHSTTIVDQELKPIEPQKSIIIEEEQEEQQQPKPIIPGIFVEQELLTTTTTANITPSQQKQESLTQNNIFSPPQQQQQQPSINLQPNYQQLYQQLYQQQQQQLQQQQPISFLKRLSNLFFTNGNNNKPYNNNKNTPGSNYE
ncbi:mitochondrial cell division protein [Dictyostelium discoideum AX4]|uniref:Mitochondrial division protein fszA n=1 Tax=Dictyostelium discoideum TaxID=44689 RepID=FTSZA_DICDI|nr:mitochondrial cell division protein [Dictyostelium discoideum AX4]Q54Z54.1 RecName: Full=Mitochondrial division protein fszA [Dictyostelium discoideum]EAL68534.1 mitochondrial cell division protein [Dictyostelium discoideum AX4]|eukprot:XP_642499.1 mitochondrial cell division protein [Dictyostelium discoideum AX4]